MRTANFTYLFAITALMVTVNQVSAEIPWQENLRAARDQAQAQNKLLLLHFYSDNCVWCDRLEEGSFKSSDVESAIEQDFVAVKVHANKNPELVKMFKVTAFPTDVIVTSDGQTLSHSVSPQEPKRYVAMLQSKLPRTMAPNQQTPSQQYANQSMPSTPPAAPNPPSFDAANGFAGGAQGRTVSSRYDQTMPGMTAVNAPQPQAKQTAKSAEPELAMEGYCSVTVISEDRWVEGKPEFGVIHLGKLYLFASDEAMQTFLSDPVTYTPVLNEIDVVRFFEERRIVPGKREWGLKDPTHNRMFFFADEAAMNHFWGEYERYTDAAISVMDQAVKDANPGT
ncbi:thiol:disulfide interchange protein precursor [Novipirellula aureliae]|uniref:Thiol:disulfide interchange protein n=1 Tax=Novipirellula aureliae TaxID=2527966 RepID=A0A5C6DM86_9BACT|nr:DUF255 domain-containing protein [Novipirellula aureliae]TWU37742.1 thiol:disulfide interchange protein precursor [Novipirellula aureliae]